MPPFGRPFGAKVDPQKRSKFDLPKRAPQYAPRPPPRALKTPREAPKSLSRGAQDAPKTLREAPKGSQEPPRELKMASKKEIPVGIQMHRLVESKKKRVFKISAVAQFLNTALIKCL